MSSQLSLPIPFVLVLCVCIGCGSSSPPADPIPGDAAVPARDASPAEPGESPSSTDHQREACGDGVDGDRDGHIDEGCGGCTPGEERSCYGGDAGHAGVGICAMGTQRCVEDGEFGGRWGECEGWVPPTLPDGSPRGESCSNEADDDCDGVIDEGCAGEERPTRDAGTAREPDAGPDVAGECGDPTDVTLAPCPAADQVRTEEGACIAAPTQCTHRSNCVVTRGDGLPAGHFLRTYLWDLSDCAGHDCCLDCARAAARGHSEVPGAWRCQSGQAHCIETVGRGECIISSGYCVCD